jgi:uncharacterized protein (TIGR00730 family)
VFCGSSKGNHPDYLTHAKELGKLLAKQHIELIYGGGNVGVMGELSRAAIDQGGKVTGIIPKKIHEMVDHIELTNLHIVENMHERKAMMYELSNGFIALPGGIGTLEELAEVMTWYQIGYHNKPIALFNVNNFYDPFVNLLHHMVEEGFLKKDYLKSIIIESELSTLLEKMQAHDATFVDKWST